MRVPLRNLYFGDFTLDRENQELRRDSQSVALQPKMFDVLRYLAENSQRLITQAELIYRVWGAIAVSEGLLRGYIRDLRRSLGDDAAHPRFIQTVPRRGYRFIAQVTADSKPSLLAKPHQQEEPRPQSGLVGREQDLTTLRQWLESALRGRRELVFVLGEAGIGKTALVSEFINQANATDSLLVGRGQCVEQFGPGKPFLPAFEALGMLCNGPRASEVLGVLNRHAPIWLSQMPGLIPDEEFEALQNRTQGTNQSRMLREICEALEVITADQPLILTFEDLQWSDRSTLDLISMFARRQQPARLILIGTYRPADVIVSNHPLKSVVRELQIHQLCRELWPDYLSEIAVGQFLASRFPDNRFPSGLGRLIHRDTGGNPLFMTAMVDDLLQRESIVQTSGHWQLNGTLENIAGIRLPTGRKIIETQLDRLPSLEQQILEAAAVVGYEFTASSVGAALTIDTAEVEEHCDELVRRQQFLTRIEDPGQHQQTPGSRYTFRHDLYRIVALDRSTPGRRVLWSLRIGEKLASDYGDNVEEKAAELAYYLQEAKLFERAAHYYTVAGERAIRRFANPEALAHLHRAIELLKKAPKSTESDALELRLQVALALPLTAIGGYASEEVTAVLSRARDLNQKLGETRETFAAIRGLHQLLIARAEYREAMGLCEQLCQIAERENDPDFLAEGLRARAVNLFYLGELSESRDLFDRVVSTCSRGHTGSKVFIMAEDPGVTAACQLSVVLWLLGYADQARITAENAVSLARKLAAPFSIAAAQSFLALVLRLLRDIPGTLEATNEAISICDAQEFPFWRAQASIDRGWATAMKGQINRGIKEAKLALASRLAMSNVGAGGVKAKLADVYLHAGNTKLGLAAVDDALKFVLAHEERPWEPELHRLKGELLLQRADAKTTLRDGDRYSHQAENCFSTAIARAREMAARSFELRACMSLHRLWSRLGKGKEARQLLGNIYGWFSEGLNTPDLIEAKHLLRHR